MIENIDLNKHIDKQIRNIVSTLQEHGYETYIVGGAVRDILLNRNPKDFDISTSAHPEDVRTILGRKRTRVIGKRFKIVHYHLGNDVVEISTFRAPPKFSDQRHKHGSTEIITNDNNYGTSEEDAWRRDFTVNSIFYNPSNSNVIDYTNSGLEDLRNKVVRIIGDPQKRFSEDPVRILRALKLVGQFGFKIEKDTEEAMLCMFEKIKFTSISRLSLELEKILKKEYAYSILRTFKEYGFLSYFLPFLDNHIATEEAEIGFSLLKIDCNKLNKENMDEYISVSLSLIALPFATKTISGHGNTFEHKYEFDDKKEIRKIIRKLFEPMIFPKFIVDEATEIIFSLYKLFDSKFHKKLRRHHLVYDICRVGTILNEYQYNDENVKEFCRKTLNSDRY